MAVNRVTNSVNRMVELSRIMGDYLDSQNKPATPEARNEAPSTLQGPPQQAVSNPRRGVRYFMNRLLPRRQHPSGMAADDQKGIAAAGIAVRDRKTVEAIPNAARGESPIKADKPRGWPISEAGEDMSQLSAAKNVDEPALNNGTSDRSGDRRRAISQRVALLRVIARTWNNSPSLRL
jgi:hypothetical protein